MEVANNLKSFAFMLALAALAVPTDFWGDPSIKGRRFDLPYPSAPEKFGLFKAPHDVKEDIGKNIAASNQLEFTISQMEGAHFVRQVAGLLKLEPMDKLTAGAAVFAREGSILEAKSGQGEIIRAGSNTNFTLGKARKLELYKGAILLWLPSGGEGIRVASPLSEIHLEGEGGLMLGVTEVGGLKAVGLHGNPTLQLGMEGKGVSLEPGTLVFVYTEGQGFSRKVDVELATIMQTASLVRDLKDPLPFLEEMAKHAKNQNRKIRNRFRALVGDAKSDKDFEMMIIRDKEEHEETGN